jgi:hypothetical protein
MTTREEALLKWMQEVTSLLCFQPEVPMKHKQDLCDRLNDFQLIYTADELTTKHTPGK